ncbi:ferrous iron transport protein A [Bacteriovoracaceae bacterium]|nr:ferrous iron transport protein A [Bacteriovoracaceae bacterium]
MTVYDLQVKEQAKIKSFTDSESHFSRSLLRHGFFPDTHLKMIKKMAGHGPVIVEVDGKEFALSKEEAANILI